jgi:hypothetical protein
VCQKFKLRRFSVSGHAIPTTASYKNDTFSLERLWREKTVDVEDGKSLQPVAPNSERMLRPGTLVLGSYVVTVLTSRLILKL